MRLELIELFARLDMDKEVKVIVITGAGDKAFCTGADLKERSASSIEEMIHERHHLISKFTSAVANVKRVTWQSASGAWTGPYLSSVGMQQGVMVAKDDNEQSDVAAKTNIADFRNVKS